MKPDPSSNIDQFIQEVKRTTKNKVSEKSIQTFYDNYLFAADLQIKFDEFMTPPVGKVSFSQPADEVLKSLSRANCIVNWITAFEVFLKGIIIDYQDLWKEKGIKNLLKKTITLNDAFTFMDHLDMKKVDLIAYTYSFQSIETINHVFGTLLNGKEEADFLDKLNFTYMINAYVPGSKDNSDMKKELIQTFETRHRIIHEGLYNGISKIDLLTADNLMVSLPNQIDYYLDSLLTAKKGKK